jgi:hypothetical protein
MYIRRMRLAIFTIILIAGLGAKAQKNTANPATKRGVTTFSYTLGAETDRYNSMSINQLTAMAKDKSQLQRDLNGMTEEVSTRTSGVALNFNLGFAPMNKTTGTLKQNQEIRVGIGFHSAKESMVSFKNQDLDTSIVFCNRNSEVTLEGSYLFKGNWGKRFTWYVGLGSTGSASFNNQMIVMSGKYFEPGEHPSAQVIMPENKAVYSALPSINGRVFIPWGIHVNLSEKTSLGLDFRRGMGVQWTPSRQANFMNKTGMFGIGLSHTLAR